jgi:rhodanese-related sulfurtransferase
MEPITAEAVMNKLDEDNVTVVNVLHKDMYDTIRIPGSANMPLDELQEGRWEDLRKDYEIIVYCADEDCTASEKAARFLDEQGFDVRDYEGGIQDWAENGYPVEGHKTRKAFLDEGF